MILRSRSSIIFSLFWEDMVSIMIEQIPGSYAFHCMWVPKPSFFVTLSRTVWAFTEADDLPDNAEGVEYAKVVKAALHQRFDTEADVWDMHASDAGPGSG
jgi:hypothetical protein